MSGVRPVDLQGALTRTPESTNPQHREAGPQATQQVFAAELKHANERRQETVRETPRGEKSRVRADARRGGRGGRGSREQGQRRDSPGAEDPLRSQEPGKGTRLDVRI